MDKNAMLEMALDKIMGDLDDVEGKSAMAHEMDECPDPLNCKMHEGSSSDNLTPEGGMPAIKIEVSKMKMPSMDGKSAEDMDGLSDDESEELKKLLK